MIDKKKIVIPNLGWFLFNWIIGFFICGYSASNQQWLCLIFLLFPLYFLITMKIKISLKIIVIALWCLFTCYFLFQKNEMTTKIFINFIDNKIPNFFSLRENAIQIIDKNYIFNLNTASYLKLLLFNEKDFGGWIIYKKAIKLGIAHLFVISGMHINIICWLFHKFLFKKINQMRYLFIFDLIVSFVIGYFVYFSISVIRIISSSVIKIFQPQLNLLEYSCLSCLIVLFLWKDEVVNYGFLMSYLCIFVVAIIDEIVNNKIIKTLLINLGCILITMPFVFKMNGEINSMVFVYNVIFSPLITICFIWFLFTTWIPPFFLANAWIIKQITNFIDWNMNFTVTFVTPSLQIITNLSIFGTIFYLKKIKKFLSNNGIWCII